MIELSAPAAPASPPISADRMTAAAARGYGAIKAISSCAQAGLLSAAAVSALNDVYTHRVEPLLQTASLLQRTAAAQRIQELSSITDDLLARAQAVARQSDELIDALDAASRRALEVPRRRRSDRVPGEGDRRIGSGGSQNGVAPVSPASAILDEAGL